MGREPGDEVFIRDERDRRAIETERVIATSRRLIQELKVLMETSRKLIDEHEAILEAAHREREKREKQKGG